MPSLCRRLAGEPRVDAVDRRLIHGRQDSWGVLRELGSGHAALVMRHPVVRRGGGSRSHLVVWPASELLEPDSDSFQGRAELARERRDYRGIDSA